MTIGTLVGVELALAISPKKRELLAFRLRSPDTPPTVKLPCRVITSEPAEGSVVLLVQAVTARAQASLQAGRIGSTSARYRESARP
ncbi:hypothetical protein ACFWFQ_20635, partial [Nocardia salmonicida]|uniref:hypothetical protein n=1 Tax=Nocardia salmonicida TaxID=53431 RepID=UPI00364D4846